MDYTLLQTLLFASTIKIKKRAFFCILFCIIKIILLFVYNDKNKKYIINVIYKKKDDYANIILNDI